LHLEEAIDGIADAINNITTVHRNSSGAGTQRIARGISSYSLMKPT